MTYEIELEDVTLRFPGPDGGLNTIYENLSLGFERGSFTAVLGPSGCGKSTLLNVINGLIRPTSAKAIRFEGLDVRENPELARKMAYVFQDARLLSWKTLRGNVEFGMRGLKVQPKDKWDELMEKYFGAVGLTEHTHYYPHQVSGGMQQRAAIVRAFVNEPEILLMDEPFSHLDEITAGELRSELVRLWAREEPRRTVVFVTHDIGEAVQLATRIVVLAGQPSKVYHEQDVNLPYPRTVDDEEAFALERELRKVFAGHAGASAQGR